MAKDKSLKSASDLSKKKKKLGSNEVTVNIEDTMDVEVKGKRRKKEVEEAPEEIPQETITDEKKQKKKKKKLSLNEVDVNIEDTMDVEVKRKRRKNKVEAPEEIPQETITDEKKQKGKRRKKKEVEEAPEEIPQETITDEKKQKKEKKHKKKRAAEEAQISDPPSPAEPTLELEGEEDLSPEEKRVMERKMKKILKKEEKKKLKAEGETEKRTEESGPTAPQQALVYLTCWAEKRGEWKFQKTRQTWLLQHMFDSDKIPDENFSVLLQYLEGLRGGSKDMTVKKALALVEESGKAPEDEAVQQRAHRAREAIQLLT
ncbi:uncharacterized protein C7orf50 homolog isoform X4 [Platichthys flesus]|uniref:uncharacterized protein C7orf50 homolog isoform X4 n=1 Tax=Platichthys flesus TaxID=8260 RepID=UPI002DBDF8A3|nr:uncharacterized protein C7orf50 homolog isoform X4 [Platichthys flesus]